MRTYYLFLGLFFFCFFINIQGQQIKKNTKAGKEIMADLNMTVYPEDPSAEAVILSKKGVTEFVSNKMSGFHYRYTLSVRLKILKNEGISYGKQSILYHKGDESEWENITNIKGVTYNLQNGDITEAVLAEEDIEDINGGGGLQTKIFNMPDVKVGSVLEVEYTLNSSAYKDLPEFFFQEAIPVRSVYYNIIIPSYLTYNFMIHGNQRIKRIREPARGKFEVSYKDEKGRIKSKTYECTAEEKSFVAENIPALKVESYSKSLNDYLSRITFDLKRENFPWDKQKSLDATWEGVGNELLLSHEFKEGLNKTGLFENGSTADFSLQKAAGIWKRIKEKVKWNGFDSAYPSGLEAALKNGIGNSADLNFLLMNALKAEGFEVYPVILRTRDKGNLPFINPSRRALNYTVTAIKTDSVYYFADASSEHGDWNILPDKCLVTQACILNPKNPEWVSLSTIFPGKVNVEAEIKTITEHDMVMNISVSYKGNSKYNFLKEYTGYKNQEEYLKELAKKQEGKIEHFSLNGVGEYNEDINIKYVLTKKIEQKNDRIYLNPLVYKFYPESPFVSEKRELPIDFDYFENYSQTITIPIQEGYVVDKLPETIVHTYGNREMEYSCNAEVGNEDIVIYYNFQINSLFIPANEYSGIKELFSIIGSKNAESIVFKKKTE